MSLDEFQRELSESSPSDLAGLRALYVNCTLKPSTGMPHTQGLIDLSVARKRRPAIGGRCAVRARWSGQTCLALGG